jgi:Zn-dependent M16 (insulinase) family peptidase
MSVNLIKRNDIEVNKIASNLFNSGIIYGDVYIILDNRENDADSYIGLLSEILKDVAMTTSEVRTLRKYEKIFKAITTDTSSDTSDTDDTDEEPNRYSNSYNDDVILRYRDTDHEQCQELDYCIHVQ